LAADTGGFPATGADRALVHELLGRPEIRRRDRTGRKKIVLSGLWTETCVALPTIQAIHDNYEVYVVEDCCGDVSQLAHENAMKRVIQAGAKPVTALTVMLEWQRDWGLRDTYDAVMDIVKTHFGAYGVGVEYAYTMVHGLPATRLAEYVVPVTVNPEESS
jgi:nicotinamidase-related amidase